MNKLIFTLAMLWMQWAIIPVAHAESDVLQWDNGGEQQVDICIYGGLHGQERRQKCCFD